MKVIPFLSLSLICVLTSAVRADVEEKRDLHDSVMSAVAYVGPLKLSLVVDRFMGQNTLDAVLENPSNDFFCVDSKVLDSTYQHILLKDKSDKEVPLLAYGEMWPHTLLGFDYSQSYLFILPNETRKIDANIGNFKIVPGEYTYDVVFSYYRCSDVIDAERIRLKQGIRTFTAHFTGKITLKPE